MKKTFRVLVVLALFPSSMGALAADVGGDKANARADAPAFFPWSDASAYVRIPKTFLREVNLWSLAISNHETMEFVVTDDFANLCAVTPTERTKLTNAVAKALHTYRMAKAKHWIPSGQTADLRSWESTVLERFAFKREPMPEESAVIYEALRQQVLAILGPERSAWFWDFGQFLTGSNVGFEREDMSPPGHTESSIHTFVLRKAELGLEVDWFTATAGGFSGGPCVQAFDPYAPESLRPVLVRWRQTIADAKTNQTASAASAPRPSAREAESHTVFPTNPEAASPPLAAVPAAPMAKWEDGVAFVDVPKTAISSFRIAGLTEDQEVSDAAVILFGLTASERRAVDELYQKMNARFEQLERAHFKRTKPAENDFLISAFPDEAKGLREEWSRALGGIVGMKRAEWLDETIQTPSGFQVRRSARMRMGRIPSYDPDWLHRGMAETRIDIRVNTGRDGQPAIQNIHWTTEGEPFNGASQSGGQIPERFRHLLTPSMLKP